MTTEKWQLYSQTGIDGPEYGVRIRPGYVVVGFQKEDAEEIIGLRDEVERLRSDWRQEHATAETWKEDFKKMQKRLTDSELLRQAQYNQIAAKDARIKELEATIKTQQANFVKMLCNDCETHTGDNTPPLPEFLDLIRGRCHLCDIARIKQLETELENCEDDFVCQMKGKDARIKELEAQLKEIEDDGDCLTAAYMLGGKKKAEENKVLIDYVKRLEAAFLRSNAAMRYYQEGNRGPWPQVGEQFKEPYIQKAREALEEIRSSEHISDSTKMIRAGGKDE